MFREIVNRIKFWNSADRIGSDIIYTHWMLYFYSTMLKLCKKKFKYFDESSDFRPGSLAVGCSKIYIGKKVVIRPLSKLLADTNPGGGGIKIEDYVMLGSEVHIFADKHIAENLDIPIVKQGFYSSKGVLLKKGCWIGAKTVICPDVVIGENSVIGAGSVVIDNIPDRVVAVGNPARIIKEIK